MDGHPDRVDPDRWRPLIMSFQKFYGLGASQLHPSALSTIPEAAYRSTDVDRAREATPADRPAGTTSDRLAETTNETAARSI